MDILVISGISGSGKSRSASYLEDIGYYIVDNLPSEMMYAFAQYCLSNPDFYQHIALVNDIRTGEPADCLIKTIDKIKQLGIDCKLLFLDCDDETIMNRYKETRRSHPLSKDGRSTLEAIQYEKKLTKEIKSHADIIINSSQYSTAKLRSEIISLFGKELDRTFSVHLMSFGYKNGLPLEADLVFDTRFMTNPYYIPELKEKTGLDDVVSDYVFSFDQAKVFLKEVEQYLEDFIPLYHEEGKSLLVVAIGCTGGRHRSVACTHQLAKFIASKGYNVIETHRDLGIY